MNGGFRIMALVDDGNGRCVSREFKLEIVYYVPKFSRTLLSVSTLIHTGHDVDFTRTSCTVFKGKRRRVACIARDVHGVYPDVTEDQALTDDDVSVAAALVVLGTELESWHRRYGHANYKTLTAMARNKVVRGLRITKGAKPPACIVCALTKATKRAPLKSRSSSAEAADGVVHADLSDSIAKSREGHQYFMIVSWRAFFQAYPMKKKSERRTR
jgi:hypothetical protein